MMKRRDLFKAAAGAALAPLAASEQIPNLFRGANALQPPIDIADFWIDYGPNNPRFLNSSVHSVVMQIREHENFVSKLVEEQVRKYNQFFLANCIPDPTDPTDPDLAPGHA